MKKIKSLRQSKLARGFFAAKSMAKALPQLLPLSDQNPELILKAIIGKNVDKFVDDVGALKGSMLKAAQLLSSYGEYYLPKEINDILIKVQSQSHFLDWGHIEPLIAKELFDVLDIEEQPIAAASIGQVHKAKHKETGEVVVLKIQYPGVKKAIDLDIRILKGLINLAKVLPRKIDMTDIYGEIKKVLEHEMDYPAEVNKQQLYAQMLSNEKGYIVPKVYPELCRDEVIVSEFIEGASLSELDSHSLSQSVRNSLGEKLFRLYFIEIFHGNLVQTDCHAGNFLIRQHEDDYELVLIDFGAVLQFDEETITNYRQLIKYSYLGEKNKFLDLLASIIQASGGEFVFDRDQLWSYCELVASPLHSEAFQWGDTTLPDQLIEMAKGMISDIKVEKPPHQFIFLDRKILGVFSIMKKLRAEVNMKKLVEELIISN